MKIFIIANWKCNPTTLDKAKKLFSSVGKGIKNIKNIKRGEVIICPPFVYLTAGTKASSSIVKIGAQNCFFEEKGAFTGEISPAQLRDLGLKYVILGHSERREYCGEVDGMINKKIKKCLELGLIPILCIGENLRQRRNNQVAKVLHSELKGSLKDIPLKDVQKILIAYEPIWAIGTGQACPAAEAGKTMLLIRRIISQLFDKLVARKINILYGGSINAENALAFIRQADFNGLLIGGASLKPKEFIKIVSILSSCLRKA